MADGKSHAKWYYIIMPIIFIGLLIYRLIFALDWLAVLVCIPLAIQAFTANDADDDQKYVEGRTHRNGFTHSILLPLALCLEIYIVVVYAGVGYLPAVLLLPTIVHLGLDISPHLNDIKTKKETGEKWGLYRGKALICFFGRRLSPLKSRLWLIGNMIIGILLIYYIPGLLE